MGGFLKVWDDLHQGARQLRSMIGISDHAWNLAQDRMGFQVATAAFALVFGKHNAGDFASPGGYLRGIVEKGRGSCISRIASMVGSVGRRPDGLIINWRWHILPIKET